MSGIISKPTASSEKLKWQAKAAFNEGNYNLVVALFSYVLEQVPRYAPYLTNRALSDLTWTEGYFYEGKALELLNRKQEAIKCYKKCCQLEPNHKEYNDTLQQCRSTLVTVNRQVDQVSSHDVLCRVCRCYPIIGVRYKFLNDRLTCLAFNAEVYEVMDTESADVAKLKPALVLSALNLRIDNANAGTALYDTIDSTFQVLLRNKFAGSLTGDSNRNQIILISDGADCSSTKCNLHQACQRVNRFMMIVKLICY
ncbi:unnamed protein product [Rotaria magnacalcarata]|uniref:Uncharacterized protein n=1 Tax=Rotaria magnacalcarata TaxID=392030 RepID=A0A816N376_9BILA|nr:unnamed protein product [Rotaria magnacalcarata]